MHAIDYSLANGNATEHHGESLPPLREGWVRLLRSDFASAAAMVAAYDAARDAIRAKLPPEPEPEEPADYPITKDTIVYRLKMGGKLAQLMAFVKALPPALEFEFSQSAWFARSTWAQYVVGFGLTEEETSLLLQPDENLTPSD